MSDRHEDWQPVEPGHVIPAGQPYQTRNDDVSRVDYKIPTDTPSDWFVDSSWRPPLELPTEACVIRANLKHGTPRILFGHPNPGEDGMTFCRSVDGLGYKADEIESFEILWQDEA